MSGRTVRPDGHRLRRLRTGRGWTVEQLARKAGCSPKSIINAENGRNVILPTLTVIAGALAVEPKELIAGDHPAPATIRIQLVIEADIEKLNNSPQVHSLIELLTKMLPASGEITVKDVGAGSVIVTVEMNEEDTLQLVRLLPQFHEHAREVIREKVEYVKSQSADYMQRLAEGVYRKPDGRYYTRISDMNSEAIYLAYLTDMLTLADSLKEMRVSAELTEGGNVPASGKPRDEQEIARDILMMAGFPVDDQAH